MKKIFVTIFIMIILSAACSPSSLVAMTPSESAPIVPTVPASPTPTATEMPPTSTPVPAVSLPVSQLTPVPSSNTKISEENVKDLQEIARYYGEINYFAKVTKDKKFLFILDPDGLTKYDYTSMKAMVHVAVANSVSDLQISNDGDLLMLDNKWLLELKNDKEPELQVISEKIHLLNFYTRSFSLSPDGTVIAVEQNQLRCDTCEHIFRIVSTEDFTDLYTSSGLTQQSLPTFSSDGKYFALADLLIEAHSDGSSNPAGGSVSISTTSDFARFSIFSIKFPFYVTDIAFSEDNNLLAIAQSNSINIYDVLSGDSTATIADLCQSDLREVTFAPSSPLRVLESSDCGSGEWAISGSTARLSSDNVPNLSRIAFDSNGNFKAIPYVQPVLSKVKASIQNHFEFLNADILSFNQYDDKTGGNHSCDLSLASGSFDCQSQTQQYDNKRYLGKDVLLATDRRYYSYVIGKEKVDIYSFDNPSQVYYSIPFRDFYFTLHALDPINAIIIYELAIGGDSSRVIIQDMKNDRILEKWEGETFIDSIVFSENNKFAGMCRKISGVFNGPQKIDRLVIFDLSEKRTVYNMDFICSGNALALSTDGTKLASEHRYLLNPTTLITRVMILDTSLPYEVTYLDFDSWFYPYAAVFSPDGAMLAVGCSSSEICFLDPSDGREIYRMQAHSRISNMAFSKDGSVLAASSDWGLISLWAVPPFTANARQSQVSPISAYTPDFSWNFDEAGNLEGWGAEDWQYVDLGDLKVQNGYLSAKATGLDPQIYSKDMLGIDTSKYARIEIRMRVSAGDSAQIFFRNGDNDWSESRSKFFSIEPGTEFKTYIIDMSTYVSWKNIVAQLRLDPLSDSNGATIEIDYIRLLP